MPKLASEHPTSDQLRAFGAGQLDPADFAALESHLSECEDCCLKLEGMPPDSFVHRLKSIEPAAFATTADGQSPTLTGPPGIPPEMTDHPRYRVLTLVGQGGMGAVYKAEHRRMDRLVALKVINPSLIRNPATVSRFQQEVKAAAKLDHPNIVRAHDADQAGDLHFLVMEYVEGTNLASVVAARGKLPVSEACGLIRQAALGLQHAHERGMVHRDIKPHNLMLSPDGVLKILDFGLARFAHQVDGLATDDLQPTASLTNAGTVMGTADYIAPEQIADARAADIRADIYALGCTLFQLLTGAPPFPEGTPTEKFKQHAETPLPIPNDWPDELQCVLRKMTAKKLDERYSTPGDVAAALEPLMRPATARAKPRRRWLATASLLLVATAITAGVVILRVPSEQGEVVITTDDPNLELVSSKGGEIVRIRDPKNGQTWELDAKKLSIRDLEHPDGLAVELPGRGSVTLRSGSGKVTVTTGPKGVEPIAEKAKPIANLDSLELAKLPNAADALKHSDIPEIARAYLGGGDPDNVPAELVAVLGDTRWRCSEKKGPLAFSADNTQIAVADDEAQAPIRILDVKTGRLVRLLSTPFPFEQFPGSRKARMRFSPDGRRLALLREGGEFRVLDAVTGRVVWEDRKHSATAFAYRQDGKMVYLCTQNQVHEILELDAETGKSIKTRSSGSVANDIAVSPDGSTMVTVSEEYGCWLSSSPTERFGTVRTVVQGSRVAFSPTGTHFAIAYAGNSISPTEVFIFRKIDDKWDKMFKFRADGESLLTFTPDGNTLVALGKGHVSRWCVADGQKLSETAEKILLFTPYNDFALSSDGQMLAHRAFDHISINNMTTGKEIGRNTIEHEAILAVAFSPDGKYLASSDMSRTRLWDLSRACAVASWPQRGGASSLAFSPDGRLLAKRNGAFWLTLQSVPDGKSVWTIETSGDAQALSFSPDGSLLAATGGERTVRIYRASDGKELRQLGTTIGTARLLFSADGSRLFAAGRYGVTVWDVDTGLEIKRLFHGQRVGDIKWLRDGNTLGCELEDGRDRVVVYLDTERWTVTRTIPHDQTSWWEDTNVFGPGARLLAKLNPDGVHLSRVEHPNPSRLFRVVPSAGSADRKKSVDRVAFSRGGRYLACGNAEGVISLLRLADRGKLPEVGVVTPAACELANNSNPLDDRKPEDVPEQVRAYIGGGDAKKSPIELVGVLGDIRFRSAAGFQYPIYSPNGSWLATPSSQGMAVTIFDTSTGSLTWTLKPPNEESLLFHKAKIIKIAFTPKSKSLIGLGSDGSIVAWNMDGRRTARVIDPVPIGSTKSGAGTALAVSADGSMVASGFSKGRPGSPCLPQIFDIASGEFLSPNWQGAPEQGVEIDDLAFNRDGTLLVSSGPTGKVFIWNLKTGKVRESLAARGYKITSIPDSDDFIFVCNEKSNFAGLSRYNAKEDKTKFLAAGIIQSYALLPDRKTIVSFDSIRDHTGLRFRLTNLETGKSGEWVEVEEGTSKVFPTFAPNSDGRTLACVFGGEVISLFDAKTFKPLVTYPGHTSSLSKLVFSGNGNLLGAADELGVTLWDLRRREPYLRLDAKKLFALNPDNSEVAVAGDRVGEVRLRNLEGKADRFISGHAFDVTCLDYSPDGKLVATGSADNTARIWHFADRWGKELATLGHTGVVCALAWSPDGRSLASMDKNGCISVIDLDEMKATRRFDRAIHLMICRGQDASMAFLADGKTLAVVTKHQICLINAKSGQIEKKLALPATLDEYDLGPFVFGPLARQFASWGRDGAIVLAQLSDPIRQRTFLLGNVKQPLTNALAFSPDGRYLATGNPDGTICLLRLAERGKLPEVALIPTPEERSRWPSALDDRRPEDVPETVRAYVGGGDSKKAPPELVGLLGDTLFECPNAATGPLEFSANGKMVAVPCRDRVCLFAAATGRLIRSIELKNGFVRHVRFSPDNRTLATYPNVHPHKLKMEEGDIRLWDINSGLVGRTIRIDADCNPTELKKIEFSSDGKLIAAGFSANGGKLGMVQVWESETGEKKFRQLCGAVQYLAFKPGSSVLLVTDFENENVCHLWDAKTGKRDPDFLLKGVAEAWSADGTTLAVRHGSQIQFYSAKGKLLRGFSANYPNSAFRFTPNGEQVVEFSSNFGNVAHWSFEKGVQLGSFQLPGIDHGSMTLSPDGQTLAVSDRTRYMRLYDSSTGRRCAPAAGHTRPITAIAYSADGKLLATGGMDNRVCLWDLATGRLLRECTETALPTLLAFSPTGQWLAIALENPDSRSKFKPDCRFKLKDVRDLKKDWRFHEQHGGRVTDLAFSPDAKFLATASIDNTVRVWNVDGEEETIKIIGHHAHAHSLAWSADGNLLASAAQDQIKVWDRKSGAIQNGKFALALDVDALRFRPDGTLVASNCGENEVGHFRRNADDLWEMHEVWHGLGERLGRLNDTPKWQLTHLAISPDGRLLAAQEESGRVLVWQPDSDPLRLRTIALSTKPVPRIPTVYPLAFSPDGRYLAVGDADGTVTLLRLAERGLVPELPLYSSAKQP